ncbi:hypothetical protein LTR78_002309 [Recurvomyces mirabilis]|uniref:SET domain-containing protein n=1 Tax=Recurvomyces mirabilis TaxID=574656 RepID=A0AAE1C504_9PEZI|nr:hypothetical protein LTR78_002309 [Recurvomyces mirabilis]KAK5160764.1 hypothetical protein LTS14_001777 [Recurvomyces mirabilis]
MALPTATEHHGSSLNHVFFASTVNESGQAASNEVTAVGSTVDTVHESTNTSRSASPSIGNSDDLSTSSGSSGSSSALNPLASSFSPKTKKASLYLPPTASRQYELRPIEGKGLGLFATSFIPRGTRIICEAPLLHIPENALHLAWGPYCRLLNPQKQAFDALHCFKPENLNPEHVSRAYLIDANDKALDEEDIEELIQDQARVMGIFACNNFQSGKGLALYETTSRLNHSCVPNVHHSWDPMGKRITVYAVRDIQQDEELCTTYLGGPGVYYVRAQRIELLRSSYGFTCTCPACTDVTGTSENRRQVMAQIAYGLQVYQYGGQGHESIPFVPINPAMALRQSEDLISMLLDEGIASLELCKAYRMASTVALAAKNWEKARGYALDEQDVEAVCLGTEVPDLVACGAAAACWGEEVRACLVKAGVFEVGQKLRRRKGKGGRGGKGRGGNGGGGNARLEPAAAAGGSGGVTGVSSYRNQKKRDRNSRVKAEKIRVEQEREAKVAEKQAKFEAEEAGRREKEQKAEYESSYPALG